MRCAGRKTGLNRCDKMYWVGVNMLCMVLASSGQHVCDTPHSVYRIPGDAVVIGFFGAHSGANCTHSEPSGLQFMQSAISTVEAIRNSNYISGIPIGLSLYDTCSQPEMAQKSLVSAMVDSECKQQYVLGGISVEETGEQVEELSKSLGLPVTRMNNAMNETLLVTFAAEVALSLHWNPINYIVSNDVNVLNQFLEIAGQLDICVYQVLGLHELDKIKPNGTAIVLGDISDIRNAATKLVKMAVLLVPLKGNYDLIPETVNGPRKIFLIMPTILSTIALKNPFNVSEEEVHHDIGVDELRQSKATLQEMQMLSDILNLIRLFKTKLLKHCTTETEGSICPELPKINSNITQRIDITRSPRNVVNALKFLSVNTEDFESFIIIELKSDGLEKVGGVRIFNQNWDVYLESNATKDELKLCRKHNDSLTAEKIDCAECVNKAFMFKGRYSDGGFIHALSSAVTLKEDAWVAALLSISSVGVLCCVAIATFIAVRVCKKDILEGNPGFSFLMLLSLIFMYTSVLPFSVTINDDHHYYTGIVCGARVFCTSLSYSLVFSVMLARSLVLASCDQDGGLMSHINGYLQTALCFFIALVQVALTLQFWAVNWVLLSKEQCVSMSHGRLFLVLLSYDGFLLLLLILISPLIIRSKRNYREGAFFTAASILCLFVWVGWCCAYCLAPAYWADASVSLGLVATATSVLVSVFIPRTYLMLSGIVRDHLVSTLPSLAHTASTSIVDVNYRSTQALYDSVTTSRGHINPNFYSDRPATPSTSRMDSCTGKQPESTYERYDTPPSPQNITRF